MMLDGEILHAATHHELLASSQNFQDLDNAHKETAGSERLVEVASPKKSKTPAKEIKKTHIEKKSKVSEGDQLIKQEEREVGDFGLKPYIQYLNQNRGYLFFSMAALCHLTFVIGQILQNSWIAANVENPQVSSDLSTVDLDVLFSFIFYVGATTNAYSNLAVLAVVTWPVLLVSIPMVLFAIHLQELMQLNGTTKSLVANHLAESIAGSMTIRAFEEEDRFFCMVLLPSGTFSSERFIGMALSYGLVLNMSFVMSIQIRCTLANYIISVERLNQYMHIPSEAPEVIEENQPLVNWPTRGKVEIQDLQIRYKLDAPLVLRGISCTFEGGHKIDIVGRTGSGKTTLIGALFRLVEPIGGKIVVDRIDISTLGLYDLRSHFGIIPQDPTLFNGTVRYNLDPLSQHTDHEIWKALGKCQLREAIVEKEDGLDSLVADNGSNWNMGQRQLFCLGHALLRRSKILVLDEATASIDNATDLILQKTISTKFSDCTVITVAHRMPTVMDCTMVLAISEDIMFENPIFSRSEI
ncbi:unnamed protein product [Camellia sinensis]